MGKWVDLVLGSLGVLMTITPPYETKGLRDVGSAVVAAGFLIRFVADMRGGR